MRVRKILGVVGCIGLVVATAAAQDGVEGTTVRPRQEDAKVKGCKIASLGDYRVNVGDLIELDYTYPVVPDSIPEKVDYKQTLIGAVAKSSLGFRSVSTPKMVGTGTIAFYLDAKKEGKDTVTLIIDGKDYQYNFTVVAK